MPRTKRVLVAQGYYHVVTRGIDQRRLFRYRQDYAYFLRLLNDYARKFEVGILHYCLMPNHIHLLLFSPLDSSLPKCMQGLLQVYASHFRSKYKSKGFIFQNRYKSRLIDNDSYLLECSRYIERNPLRANLVQDILSYPWSSFSFYARGNRDDIITFANPLYTTLGNSAEERQRRYYTYVYEPRPYEDIVDKALRIR